MPVLAYVLTLVMEDEWHRGHEMEVSLSQGVSLECAVAFSRLWMAKRCLGAGLGPAFPSRGACL
jgi:hypothetical protein